MLNQIANLPKKLFHAHPKGQEPITVYYDGGCGPCTAIADFTDRLDLGNKLRWEPNFSSEADDVFKDMTQCCQIVLTSAEKFLDPLLNHTIRAATS